VLHPPVAGSCFGSARRLHVTALRGHCESHEGAVLVASSAVYHGAAPEKKPAGRLSSRLRSQLESRAVWSKPRLERDHSAAFSARTALQRCKHARATCVRLPDLSSRFSRVPLALGFFLCETTVAGEGGSKSGVCVGSRHCGVESRHRYSATQYANAMAHDQFRCVGAQVSELHHFFSTRLVETTTRATA
jgi:hypothetical protein